MAQNFLPANLSMPRSWARAIKRWREPQFKAVMLEVRRNMTGRMLDRRTGRALRNVMASSRTQPLGWVLATNLPYLIAWMEGSPRKGYTVVPRRRKALRFEINGKVIFTRRSNIPPWRFSPRQPVIENAMTRRWPRIIRAWTDSADQLFRESFPSGRRKVTIRI